MAQVERDSFRVESLGFMGFVFGGGGSGLRYFVAEGESFLRGF